MTKKDFSKLTLADLKSADGKANVQAFKEESHLFNQTEEGQAKIRELLKAYGIDVESGSARDENKMEISTQQLTDEEVWQKTPLKQRHLLPPDFAERFDK